MGKVPPTAGKPRPDTTWLQKIAQASRESATLMAALELDIFTAIAHGHDTVAAAAKTVGISRCNAGGWRRRSQR
jgi:hypothetical protein